VAGFDQYLDASHYECLDQFRQAGYAPSATQNQHIKPGITPIGSGVYRLSANTFQATAIPVSFHKSAININNSSMVSPSRTADCSMHSAAAARITPEPYADVSLSQQSSQSAWGSPIARQQCMATPTHVPGRPVPGSGPYGHSAGTEAPYSMMCPPPCEQQPQQQSDFGMLSRQLSTNSEVTTLAVQRPSSSGMQHLLRAGSAGQRSIAGSSHSYSSMELTSETLGDVLTACMPQQQGPAHEQHMLYEQYSSPSAEQYRKLCVALPAVGGAAAGNRVQHAQHAAAVAHPVQVPAHVQQANAAELMCHEEVVCKPAAAAVAEQQRPEQRLAGCTVPPAAAAQQQQQEGEGKQGPEQAFAGWFARCRWVRPCTVLCSRSCQRLASCSPACIMPVKARHQWRTHMRHIHHCA
jgi:hypothetical protein